MTGDCLEYMREVWKIIRTVLCCIVYCIMHPISTLVSSSHTRTEQFSHKN